MAEVGFTPEAFTIKPPERGPLDGVKRKVFDFVKSQTPSAHARRTMERYDWVGDQLDGKSRELYEKMRPAVEKAAKVAGVSTTAMEIIFATQVAAALAILGGKVGGDLLLNKEIRNKTVAGVKDVAEKAKNESKTIVEGAYKKVKQGVTAGLGAIGAGGALEWLKHLGKRPAPDSAPGQPAASPTTEAPTQTLQREEDHNKRFETELSSDELYAPIKELRDYSLAALARSKMDVRKAGRVALVEPKDSDAVLLIREVMDPLMGDTDRSFTSVKYIDRKDKKIISIDLSAIRNIGSVDVYDDPAFDLATRHLATGLIATGGPTVRIRLPFDTQQDLDSVLNFIRSHP